MEAVLTSRRLLAIGAITAVVALTSACGGGGAGNAPAASPGQPLQKYTGQYVSFHYPAGWKALRFRRPVELHSFPFVYLSTQALHSPCSTQGSETTCGWPVKRLRPGGVLAVWQLPYSPPCAGSGCSGPAGTPVRIDGHHATRQVTEGGVCRAVGADRTIDVMVKDSVEFTACLRGPNLAQNERRIDALLRSTQFAQSGSGNSS
jgi:hypothetical protein